MRLQGFYDDFFDIGSWNTETDFPPTRSWPRNTGQVAKRNSETSQQRERAKARRRKPLLV
jgi:hypothetical protein